MSFSAVTTGVWGLGSGDEGRSEPASASSSGENWRSDRTRGEKLPWLLPGVSLQRGVPSPSKSWGNGLPDETLKLLPATGFTRGVLLLFAVANKVSDSSMLSLRIQNEFEALRG